MENKDIIGVYTGAGSNEEEAQGKSGHTYRTSNIMLQSYTGESKMVHYDYNTIDLADGAKVSIVNYNTGREDNLTTLENNILDIFSEEISPYLDDPNIRKYMEELPHRIFERKEESKKVRLVIEEIKTPKLKGVTLRHLARKLHRNKGVGGKTITDIALALDSLSRKGCEFLFYRIDDKTNEKVPVVRRRCRFFHIKYDPQRVWKTTRLITARGEDGKVLRDENNKLIKTTEDLNIYNTFDVVLEEEYFWLLGGWFLQPINIRELKYEAQYPDNELATWLYWHLVGQRGNYLKHSREAVKAKEKELKQDTNLTEEDRVKSLSEYETECLTCDVKVSTIIKKLRGTSYHRGGGDVIYDFYGVFDDQLPEVMKGLKKIGIVRNYYVSGKGEARVLHFVYNKEWINDQVEKLKGTHHHLVDDGVEVEMVEAKE